MLVNNAAIQPPASYVRVDELPAELWQRMLAVNLTGYTFLAKHALRQMREQGSGVVVNLASGQAHRTARKVPAYGPMKAANLLQAMQWGVEYARDGIRVVSVSPGAIDTPLVRASLAAQGGEAELANRHPLGRLGRPDEVASAVLWLASSGGLLHHGDRFASRWRTRCLWRVCRSVSQSGVGFQPVQKLETVVVANQGSRDLNFGKLVLE